MWSWGDCYLVSVVLGLGLWSLVFGLLRFFFSLFFLVASILRFFITNDIDVVDEVINVVVWLWS